VVTSFRQAAQAQGRSGLKVIVRANVPLTADPLPEDSRSFLGGSANQIASDIESVEPLGVDHVLFNNVVSSTLDEALKRLEELQTAVRQAG